LLVLSPLAASATPALREYASHLMVEQDVAVTARMTGIIVGIHVERGAVVAKSQPLASLDARDLDLDIRESKEEMELRQAELARARALAEGKILSRAELDERQARFEVAQAKYEKTKELRDRAVVRAPFAGVVSERYARIGQKVIEDESIPLFKITAAEPLLARIYLPEEELMRVRVGDAVEIVPVKFPESKTSGTVQFVSPTVDAASGTFQVLIRVRRVNGAAALRPGVAVRVRFPSRP
jgi:membrane fusion protein (multidrug efflux system)